MPNTQDHVIVQLLSSQVGTKARAAIAKTAAFYACVVGILNIGLALGFQVSEYAMTHDRFFTLGLRGESALHKLIFGILILILAYEIYNKKRAALFLLVILLVVKAGMGMFVGHRLSTLPALAMALLFLFSSKYFAAMPEPAALRRFVKITPVLLLAITGLGILGICGYRAGLGVSVHGLAYFSNSARLVTGIGQDFHLRGWPEVFGAVLNILMLLGILCLMSLLLRSWRCDPLADAAQQRKARELVRRHGGGLLSHFNLREGKNLFFSEDGDAFLARKLVGGVAVSPAIR